MTQVFFSMFNAIPRSIRAHAKAPATDAGRIVASTVVELRPHQLGAIVGATDNGPKGTW